MEEKIIKQFKTSVPFPLLIYKTNITYNEVRKASGIAYILLDLMQKSKITHFFYPFIEHCNDNPQKQEDLLLLILELDRF